MKTVLAPIDFSPVSRRVVEEATALARAVGARLVLLHVVAPAFIRTAQAANKSAQGSYVMCAEKYVMAELAKWQHRLRDEGVTAHTVHRIGAAGPQIIEQAERLDADYIVMGSHGHGAFYDLLVGSTTLRVLKAAQCPVAIVPAAAKRPGFAKNSAPTRGLGAGVRDASGIGQEMRSSSHFLRGVAASHRPKPTAL